MDILLTGQWADDDERDTWLAALQAAVPRARWTVDHGEAEPRWPVSIEVAVVANPPPGRLQGLPRLRLIQSLWAGVDRLLADTTLPAGIPIARMIDPAMNAAMAETALWAVLTLQRGFHHYAAQQRATVWRQLPQRRADEVCVTVLGGGQMGATAARRLAAQGLAVRVWRATPGAIDGLDVRGGTDALAPLLADSDIVVNLLPLTPATQGLIDARFLSRLPPGAALVNLARGAHVVEADLLAALDSGRLDHAVLDVFATEPLPAGHPFWHHPRVTLLPHAAAFTDPRSAAAVVAANLRALVEGRALTGGVDRSRGY